MDTYNDNPYQSPATPPEAIPEHGSPQLARRLTRLVASIVDSFVGLVFTFPLMFLTGYWQRAMQQQVSMVDMAMHSAAGLAVYMLLHGYLLATRGQTIGKLLLRVRIVDYHTGALLPLAKLIGLRLIPIWVVGLIPFPGSSLILIDILFIFGSERRCVHDLIAGTKVVEA